MEVVAVKRATYIGDRDDLAGKPAMLRPGVDGSVQAKFIVKGCCRDVPHGWTPFAAEEFWAPEEKRKEIKHD